MSITLPPVGDGMDEALLPTTCSPAITTLEPRNTPVSQAPERNVDHS